MENQLSLYTPPFKNIKSYFEMVDLAEKYGIKNLETLNILDFSEPNIELAKELRKYADSKGINICCVSVGINLVGEDREENIEKVKKFADIAKVLGSPYLHHTIVFEFENPDNVLPYEDVFFERGILAVREIYDYAEKIGIKTMCEEQGFIFNGSERFNKFLNVVDRDIGVVADLGNIMFVDELAHNFIPELKGRIYHAHVKDFKICKNGTYTTRGGNHLIDCSLGEGDAELEKSCKVLSDMGYTGCISLECMMVDETEEKILLNNIEYLHSIK